MTAYYVLGGLTVLWAVVLTALGLTRPDFPPTGAVGRALVGLTVALVGATLVALFATTHVEHPREEAAAEAAEREAEAQARSGKDEPARDRAPEQPSGQKPAGEKPAGQAPAAKTSAVGVVEKEFEIDVDGGTELQPANYTFEVHNQGKIEHDLAVEGNGVNEKKTPLIPAGKQDKLTVDLKPGTYRMWCTVPGHDQAGMDIEVTVK